ncbi:MAG: hypothetical protein KDA85_13755 [Planctomycetaceae bacterium]|nr:hypothetical protein [Planctomycetaceae bacterium]
MKNPWKRLHGWIDDYRLLALRREVEAELTRSLGRELLLRPAGGGRGHNRVFLAVDRATAAEILATVRIPLPWRQHVPAESLSCRTVLPGEERVLREARVCTELAAVNVAPRPLRSSHTFYAGEHLPWSRLKDVVRRDAHAVWGILPAVLRVLRSMHRRGIAHLDLNCGNVLVSPDRRQVRLIDFEYAPAPGVGAGQLQAFDLLRLLHSLLRPRRASVALLADVPRLLGMIATDAPHLIGICRSQLPPDGFEQLQRSGRLGAEIVNLLCSRRPAPAIPEIPDHGEFGISSVRMASGTKVSV